MSRQPPTPSSAPQQWPTGVPQQGQQLTMEQRQALLSAKIRAEVGRGWRVESQDPYGAVLVRGHRVNHILHAILTIFLLGLWLFVWIPMAIMGGEKRETVGVDDWGNIAVRGA